MLTENLLKSNDIRLMRIEFGPGMRAFRIVHSVSSEPGLTCEQNVQNSVFMLK